MPIQISPAQWAQVQALFHAANEAGEEERARLLASEEHDLSVREHVRRLLAARRETNDPLETPALATMAPSLVGQRVGPYYVTRRIGQGGMGAVYEGQRADGTVEQRVAIKTLWRGADSDVLVRRFRTERRILAGLNHPNIAQFFDAGATESGTPYLVMEYVDGRPIDEHCDVHRLDLTSRLKLFLQVCEAVQHAHRTLIIHRDLKPSNVLVSTGGQAKLLDFGVAKLLDDPRTEGTLTSAGFSPFTAAYAAPEQISGGSVSTATDVYALGALLSVLLSGRPPIDVGSLSPADALAAIRTTPSLAPSDLVRRDTAGGLEIARARGFTNARALVRELANELDAIVQMALRKEPERRYATVDALAEDVARYLRRERVLARPDTLAYRARTFVRRHRAVVVGGTIAVLSLIVSTAVSLVQARESRRAAERSERVARFLARVTTQDASTVAPIARLGSRGTVAQLLDSLLRRVPNEFPDDARVRAQLYTSIGSNYTAQGRLADAQAVLDSAVYLAAQSYGRRTDMFATASLEMARTIVARMPPEESERHVRAALSALAGREAENPELYARAVMGLSMVRHMRGEVRDADSLARVVVSLETKRTP
jgi:serine/threonine-protein kinase